MLTLTMLICWCLSSLFSVLACQDMLLNSKQSHNVGNIQLCCQYVYIFDQSNVDPCCQAHECQSHFYKWQMWSCSCRGKFRGSPKSIGFILWRPLAWLKPYSRQQTPASMLIRAWINHNTMQWRQWTTGVLWKLRWVISNSARVSEGFSTSHTDPTNCKYIWLGFHWSNELELFWVHWLTGCYFPQNGLAD